MLEKKTDDKEIEREVDNPISAVHMSNADKTSPGEEVLRIEEEVGVSWSGVKGCDHTDRINAECASGFKNWTDKKILEHLDRHAYNWGHGGGTVRTTFYNPTFGSRSCSSYVALKCYIEFI